MAFEFSSEYYREFMETLRAARKVGFPTFLWGDPGTGKTTVLKALADYEGLNFESVSAPQLGIDGATGLPFTLEDSLGTDTDTPAWGKRVVDLWSKKKRNTVVLFSEFSNTHRTVQAPYLNILLEGTFANGQRLPPGTWIVADGNGIDSAVDSEGLAAPTANRFLHIEWDPPLEDWLEGMSANWGEYGASDREMEERMKVYTYIQRMGMDHLHKIPGDDGEYRGFPTRRSWDFACKILAHCDSPGSRFLALTGLVGETEANSFTAFEAEINLPNPSEVLADPSSVDWDSMGSDEANIVLRSVLNGVGRNKVEEVAELFKYVENTNRRDAGATNLKLFFEICLANSKMPVSERMVFVSEVFMKSTYGDILRESGLI